MKTTGKQLKKVILILLVIFTLSIPIRQVRASSENQDIFSHCNLKQTLAHRSIRQRIDFGLSGGKGIGYGLPGESTANESMFQAMDPNRVDFGLSDGKANGLGLPDGTTDESKFQAMDSKRMDFGLSDGRGNGAGIPESANTLIYKALTLICP